MAKKAKPSARRVRGKKTSGRVSRIRTQKRSRAAPRRVRTASRRTTSRRVTRKPAASARPIKPAIQQVSRPAPSAPAASAASASSAAPAATPKESLGTFIGDIDHYFTHLNVGILEVRGAPVQVGDKIRIKGATTDFVQTVQSMQLDHQPVQRADKGKSVGLKVEQHVREHDKVYRL